MERISSLFVTYRIGQKNFFGEFTKPIQGKFKKIMNSGKELTIPID